MSSATTSSKSPWRRFSLHSLRLPSGLFGTSDDADYPTTDTPLPPPSTTASTPSFPATTPLTSGSSGSSPEDTAFKERIATLLFEGNLDLLATICKINQFGDGNSMANSVMMFLRKNGLAENFVTRMLTARIGTSALTESKDLTNVLRDNSMTVMLLTTFAKIEGAAYLKDTLTGPVGKILEIAGKVEVNPESLPRGEEEAKENLENLVSAVNIVLDHIIQCKKDLPSSFRRICAQLKSECLKKLEAEGLPEDYAGQCSLRLVGSFLFLRFFCPALSAPHQFGVTEQTTFTAEERRGLILIAKVFISLGADSDLAAKEEYMNPLNTRLIPHKEKMREYLAFASSPVPPRESSAIRPGPDQFEKTVAPVISFLNKNMKKLEDLVQVDQHLQPQLDELKFFLGQVDVPPSPATKEARAQTVTDLTPTPSIDKRKQTKSFLDSPSDTPKSPDKPQGNKLVGVVRSILRKPKAFPQSPSSEPVDPDKE